MNSENWKEIELNYCGTQVKGIYKISDRLMTVVYGSRTKTAKLGILPAEMLAHRDMIGMPLRPIMAGIQSTPDRITIVSTNRGRKMLIEKERGDRR